MDGDQRTCSCGVKSTDGPHLEVFDRRAEGRSGGGEKRGSDFPYTRIAAWGRREFEATFQSRPVPLQQKSREPPVGRRERRSDAQRRAWQRMVRSSLSTLTPSAGRTDGIGNEAASCRSAVLAVNVVIDRGGKNVKGFEGAQRKIRIKQFTSCFKCWDLGYSI